MEFRIAQSAKKWKERHDEADGDPPRRVLEVRRIELLHDCQAPGKAEEVLLPRI